MTRSQAKARVAEARRALDAARDARERDHNPATAASVAIAQLRFDEARRILARSEFL